MNLAEATEAAHQASRIIGIPIGVVLERAPEYTLTTQIDWLCEAVADCRGEIVDDESGRLQVLARMAG